MIILRVALAVITALAAQHAALKARTYTHLFRGSLSYAWPGGGLTDSTAAQSALGLSLGYLYKADQHLGIGVRGTWTQLALGTVDTVDLGNYSLTHVGMYLGVLYKPLKHGWSPYAEVEGGLGYVFANEVIANQPRPISGLSEVKVSAAASIGVTIPVSEQIEADVAGRYFHTFVTNGGFSMLGVHAGIVYSLR